MKMCKNRFDVLMKPTKCSECVFKRAAKPCLWIKLVSIKVTLDCGSIQATSLSDIFKL